MVEGAQSIQDICIASYDAYSEICSKLMKLCPRLVPSPLWGLSLASIARMSPQAALAICDDCDKIVEQVHEYWMNLNRNGECEVCGGKGTDIDEDWRYCTYSKEGKLVSSDDILRGILPNELHGIAYLVGLKLLCEKCHLAKHLGYSMVRGMLGEAVEQLAKINGMERDELKQYTRLAFRIHLKLSRIKDWSIRIGKLTGLDENLRDEIEMLLNMMYRKGLYLFRGWLNYWNEKYEETVKPRIERETISILLRAIEELHKGETDDTKIEVVNAILNIIEKRFQQHGILVYKDGLNLFITRTLGMDLQRTSLGRLRELVTGLIDREDLSGKWIVFVPVLQYPKVFSEIVNSLKEKNLAYSAAIFARRKEYKKRRELPVIIDVPSALAIEYVAGVAKVVKNVLKMYDINRKLYFKPLMFSRVKSYGKQTLRKPFIYIC